MNLTHEDAEAIAAYIRLDRTSFKSAPYQGPIFVDLDRLEELHMRSAKSHVHYALMFASGKWTSTGRAA